MDLSRRQVIQGLVTWVACPQVASARATEEAEYADSAVESAVRELGAPGITIRVNARGRIVGLRLGAAELAIPVDAGTVLSDCDLQEVTTPPPSSDGALEFRSRFVHRHTGDSCMVVERYSATADSIRWELTIYGSAAPWSTAIETRLCWTSIAGATFWTAWDRAPGSIAGWSDPLVPAPFNDLDLRYGGYIAESDAFCLPLATVLDATHDIALSLVQSPESALLDMRLATRADGEIVLSRVNHRISAAAPVSFSMDLVPHAADWRAALGWMANRYPGYFNPPNSDVYRLDGCGAYSAYQGRLARRKLRHMAFSVNWNAHFDFPYLGMMIPPVEREVKWSSWYRQPTSLQRMSRYDQRMRRDGFHVLEYFVLTECGNDILPEAPPRKAQIDGELWQDANDFVHYAIPEAIVRAPDGGLQYSNWHGNVVVDPAEPVWREHLLGQVQRLVRELPASDGICIDRMDWLTLYNTHRDDGASWIDGAAARSLLNSWKDTGSQVAGIVHGAGKVVYANPLVRRLDAVQFVDGLYDEYGDHPSVLNQCALLALYKPAIAWTTDLESLGSDPDAYFQRHLHLGVFPSVPFPAADHSIAPNRWAERYYLDYGPLLAAMRGKRWLLRAHAIEIQGGAARVNLFQVPGGYAIPITFAAAAEEVTIVLRLFQQDSTPKLSAQVWWPATRKPLHLQGSWSGNELRFQVPVNRGCALLAISHTLP